MAVTGVYINVLDKATGEVKQVNVYNSVHDVDDGMYKMLIRTWTDDVGNVGEEDCFIAVTDNENSQEYKDFYSGWTFNDPKLNCIGTTDTVVHVLTEAGAPFSMYNWAWANYQIATGEDRRTLTSFNTAYTPSQKQLSRVNNAAIAFNNCRKLTDITPFANLVTYGGSVNFMHTFNGCSNITDISALGNWEMSNATDFGGMFRACDNISSLSAMANWNTCNVTNMAYMFYQCYNIVDIDGVANWDTGNVTSMDYMFGSCRNVVNYNALSGWNTSSLTRAGYMFSHIYYVSDASFLGGWNMASMTNATYMLTNCQNLTCVSLPSSLANTVNCNITYMFMNCKNLAGNIFFKGAYVNNAANCFNGCSNYLKNIVANRKVDNGTYDQFYKSMGNAKTNSAWNANLYPLDPKITFNITDEAGEKVEFIISAQGQMSTEEQGTVVGEGSYVFTGEWGDTVTYTVTGDGYTTVNGTVDLLLDDMTVDIHMYGEQHHVFTESEVLVGLDGGTIPMASWLDTTATNYNCVINDSGSDNGYSSWATMKVSTPFGGGQDSYSVEVKAWDAGDATADELDTGRSVLIDSTGTFEDGTNATTSMYVRQTSDAPDEYLVHKADLEVSEWGKQKIDITDCYDTNLTSLAYNTTYSWINLDVIMIDANQTITVSPNLVEYPNPFKEGDVYASPTDRTGSVSVTGTYSSGATKTITFNVAQNGGYDNYFYAKEIKLADYNMKDIYLDSDYVVTNATDYVPDNQLDWCEIAIESSTSGDKMMIIKVNENTEETERFGVINLYVTFAQSQYERGETGAYYSISVYQPGCYNTGGGANPDPVEPDPGYDGPDET